jgi:hypothetical protein
LEHVQSEGKKNNLQNLLLSLKTGKVRRFGNTGKKAREVCPCFLNLNLLTSEPLNREEEVSGFRLLWQFGRGRKVSLP